MDNHDLNACLESLESRLNQLRQADQRRAFVAEKALSDLRSDLESKVEELSKIVSERDARANEKAEKQKEVEELKQQVSAKGAELERERKERAAGAERVKALEGELAGVKGERDARVKEKQKEVEELKQQVSARTAELEAERQEKAAGAQRMKALEGELAGVKGEREAQAKKAKEAREEAELTLLQLHQVQEELEHYFLKSRGADQLAAAQQDQLLRAQALMARLLPEASTLAQAQRVAVEVLPPSPPAAPVQTEALLNSYSTSLRRASALLQRAIRS